MNLLFILPAYEPSWPFGGVVRCMSVLCRGLASLGHNVIVYTLNADGMGGVLDAPQGQPVNQGGVDTYFFPSTFGPKSVWDSRRLVSKLQQTIRNFDLVYVSAIWQWLGISVSALCGQVGIPLVIGPHGSFDQSLLKKRRIKKALYWHFFLKRAISRAAALHFTTEYERHESTGLLGRFPSFIVPNGIDCNYFIPQPEGRRRFRQKYGIANEDLVVVTAGRPDPKKRVDLLIRGLSRQSGLKLLVVGSDTGELADRWKELARILKVSDRVIWTGHLQGEELLQAYSAGDVFSLISHDENFGMVVIEALACGLPILVTKGVGVWEEVESEKVGMGVVLDGEEIGNALKHFVSHRSLWAVWGENARRVAIERFSHNKIAILMAQAFKDVLKSTSSTECRWETGVTKSNLPKKIRV